MGARGVGLCRQREQYAWRLRGRGVRYAQGTSILTDSDLLRGRVTPRRPSTLLCLGSTNAERLEQ